MDALASIALAAAHLDQQRPNQANLSLVRAAVPTNQLSHRDIPDNASNNDHDKDTRERPIMVVPPTMSITTSPSMTTLGVVSSSSSSPCPSPSSSSGMVPLMPSREAFGNGPRVVSVETLPTTDGLSSSSNSNHSTTVASPATSNAPSPTNCEPDEHGSDGIVPADPDSLEGLVLLQTLDALTDDIPPPPAQSEVITTVKEDDVLCGRGGETNHHPGNIRYRGLVKKYQLLYLKAKRRDKPKIARLIVDTVRSRHGRFLKKEAGSNSWRDVGNNKAREKTSQALREGAPELRNGQPPKNKNKKRKRENINKRQRRHGSGTMDQLSMAAALVSPTPSSLSLTVPTSQTGSAMSSVVQMPTAPLMYNDSPILDGVVPARRVSMVGPANAPPPTAVTTTSSAPLPTPSSDTETEGEDATTPMEQQQSPLPVPSFKRAKHSRGPRLKLLKARLIEAESD